MKTLQELIQQEQGRFERIFEPFIFLEGKSVRHFPPEIGDEIKYFLAEAMTATAKAVGELAPLTREGGFFFTSEMNMSDAADLGFEDCRARFSSALKTFFGEERV